MTLTYTCPACHWSGATPSNTCPQCGNPPEGSPRDFILPSALVADVERAWLEASKAHPKIQHDFRSFLEKVSEIISKHLSMSDLDCSPETEGNLMRSLLATFQWQELYLASACSRGDPAAWEIFHQQYIPVIRRTAQRALGNPAHAKELAETLITDLFLPNIPGSSSSSKIAQYHGIGSLEGWIKVVIHRLAIDRFRSQQKQVSFEDLDQEPSSTSSHGQADHFLKRRDFHEACRKVSLCLTEVLNQRTTEEKLALKMYYLQGATLKEIGTWLRVHESTASRMIEKLRGDLRKQVVRELQAKFNVKKNEVAHVIDLAAEGLQMDLKSILSG